MAEIFVTSDHHFQHERIIQYCGRPFPNAEEMDEEMIRRWNSVVTPQDKVYHLGDVYFGDKAGARQILSRLNGKKRLILGNHDDAKDDVLFKNFQRIQMWRMFPEFGLLLTHVPVHPSTLSTKGLTCVHGHIHNRTVLEPGTMYDDPRYKCACVEHTNYTPVNIEELRVR